MEEKLKLISGEYDEWVAIQDIDLEAAFSDDIQVISCDTRDFAIGWNFKQPEPFKKAVCGFESRINDGLRMLELVKQSGNIGDFLIAPHEILTWLDALCQHSGGYEEDWRFLTAKVSGCSDWDLKYIRFVRQPDGQFIVCNNYMFPIQWRQVIDNLYDPYDAADEPKENKTAGGFRNPRVFQPFVLHNYAKDINQEPKPRKAYWDGPCCARCKNRFKGNNDYCFHHHKDVRCYRFKLDM